MSNKSITNDIERVPELKRFLRAISFREEVPFCEFLFNIVWVYVTIGVSSLILLSYIYWYEVAFSILFRFVLTSALGWYMIHFIKSYRRCYGKSKDN